MIITFEEVIEDLLELEVLFACEVHRDEILSRAIISYAGCPFTRPHYLDLEKGKRQKVC